MVTNYNIMDFSRLLSLINRLPLSKDSVESLYVKNIAGFDLPPVFGNIGAFTFTEVPKFVRIDGSLPWINHADVYSLFKRSREYPLKEEILNPSTSEFFLILKSLFRG